MAVESMDVLTIFMGHSQTSESELLQMIMGTQSFKYSLKQ